MLASDFKLILMSAETIEVNAVVREQIHNILCETDTRFEAILNSAQPIGIDPVPATRYVPESGGPAGLAHAGFDVEGAVMDVDSSLLDAADSSCILK